MSGWDRRSVPRALLVAGVLAVVAAALPACSAPGSPEPPRSDPAPGGPIVEVNVPSGASARGAARALGDAGLVDHPRLFALYAHFRGAAGELKSGRYQLPADAGWGRILEALRRGEVVTRPVTVPPGFRLREVAPRISAVTGISADSVLALARSPALADSLGVPGPTLEGYLFPESYRFAEGVSPGSVLATMVERYRRFWNPARRAMADSLGLDEREVVTLASIVEKEARVAEERPLIAGVYLNRIRRGMLLQADPTVQFALDTPRARLLYRDIDRVADDPYNTYTHPGLPPGPIASPGEASLRSVLAPEESPYLYFVARPDGSHVFSRTQREHVNAKNRIRRERRQLQDRAGEVREDQESGTESGSGTGPG